MLATVYLLAGVYLGGLILLAALVRRLLPFLDIATALSAGALWPMLLGYLLFGGRK